MAQNYYLTVTFPHRICKVLEEGSQVVDVDGTYLYQKQQSLKQSIRQVAPLPPPAPPLAVWEVVTDNSVNTVAVSIPIVTSGEYCILFQIILTCIKFAGTLYTYLACGTGHSPMQSTDKRI